MSGVVQEALQFSFRLAAEGTRCDGALLEIEHVPVTVHCPDCDRPQTLPDCWQLICPACGASTPQLLTGRELDLVSIEIAPE